MWSGQDCGGGWALPVFFCRCIFFCAFDVALFFSSECHIRPSYRARNRRVR